ncbi:MAG: hypothetical protein ACXQTW_01925 [Candidatus Methanospirareceae archaeon]
MRNRGDMENKRLWEGLLILGVYVAVALAMVFAEDISHIAGFHAICGGIGVGFFLSSMRLLSVLRKEEDEYD